MTKDEISAAALQFVRKVSGFRKPSKSNEVAFDTAVSEIAHATERLLGKLTKPTSQSSARNITQATKGTTAADRVN